MDIRFWSHTIAAQQQTRIKKVGVIVFGFRSHAVGSGVSHGDGRAE